MKTVKITTITGLRKELMIAFEGLRDGSLEPKIAKEMNNASGKIISTAKIQLEYANLRGKKPSIPFLV